MQPLGSVLQAVAASDAAFSYQTMVSEMVSWTEEFLLMWKYLIDLDKIQFKHMALQAWVKMVVDG